jgi:hypothetical protein
MKNKRMDEFKNFDIFIIFNAFLKLDILSILLCVSFKNEEYLLKLI